MAPSGTRDPADAANRQSALELRFRDVGRGDAILVRYAGKTVLLDAGETDGMVTLLRARGGSAACAVPPTLESCP